VISQLNESLKGLPDRTLTIMLIAVCLFGIVVAIWGPPILKAAVAAWFIAP